MATPHELHVPKEQTVTLRDEFEKTRGPAKDPVKAVRRVCIRAADIAADGYTDGYGRCNHELRYGAGTTTKPHSEACRSRFNEDLAKAPMGRIRLVLA